jgi:hypothetical protein
LWRLHKHLRVDRQLHGLATRTNLAGSPNDASIQPPE